MNNQLSAPGPSVVQHTDTIKTKDLTKRTMEVLASYREENKRLKSLNADMLAALENYTNPETGKQMCELISKFLKESKGEEKTPLEIWEYSLTGELTRVFELHREASDYFARAAIAKARGQA